MSFNPDQLDNTTREAISAIYSDAYTRGHRAGFASGVAEKVWLHKNWPAVIMAVGGICMVIGALIVGTQL